MTRFFMRSCFLKHVCPTSGRTLGPPRRTATPRCRRYESADAVSVRNGQLAKKFCRMVAACTAYALSNRHVNVPTLIFVPGGDG